MDTTTAKIILQAAKMSFDAVKKDIVIKKLDQVLQKTDQIILREIRAAYEALDDVQITSNAKTRESRLDFCENNLLKNTKLDPSLKMDEYPNAYWMAIAYYGLAFVCTLREDTNLAAKYFVKIFELDPHLARTELASSIYKLWFEPKCKEVLTWYQEQLKALNEDNFDFQVTMGKIGAGLIAIGSIGGAILTVPALHSGAPIRLAGMGIQQAGKLWDESDAVNYRRNAIENLNQELESELDHRCREVATAWLSGSSTV